MNRIMQLSIERHELARRLFRDYPYKKLQGKLQGIDSERMVPFYLEGMKRSIGEGNPHWIALNDELPVAVVGLSRDAWHSGVYGIRMAKVQPWINTQMPQAGPRLLTALEHYASQNGISHLSVRLDGQDFTNLHFFQAAGWKLVDVSLKFSLPMPFERRLQVPGDPGEWNTRLAEPGDRDWIRGVGSRTHTASHFLNDPTLPRDKSILLFQKWLEKSLDGMAYKVYVLVGRKSGAEEKPLGFVTYLRAKRFAEVSGRNPLILDFVLLDPSVRGQGVGPWFIHETLLKESAEAFDYCELRTSAHNLPAVVTYEKLGFQCVASDMVLHKRV